MSSQPCDGSVEEGHCCSNVPVVDDAGRIESLRQALSHFNHRCRNSLNGIKMSLYLCKRAIDGPMPGDWSELDRAYQQLEVSFDRLQMIYRPLNLTLVRSPLGRLIDEHLPLWRSWFSLQGRTLEVAAPAVDLPGDFDPMQLGLGLDAFVAWRAESGPAGGKSALSWKIADEFFEVRWEESRPANGSHVPERDAGEPEGTRPAGRIESLAQPLIRRIVAAHRGTVVTIDDPAFVVTLRWPRFEFSGQGDT